MDEIDRDALQRAFETARKDPTGRRRIDEWRAKGRSWEEVARSCACHCQHTALGLSPWQMPPTSPTIANHLDTVLSEPFGDPSGRREAGEILKKLSGLGLSRFEPDPLQAIAAAEQRQAAK